MKRYVFYHPDSGALHPRIVEVSHNSLLAANTPEGYVAIASKDAMPVLNRFDFTTKQLVSSGAPAPKPRRSA